MTFTVPDLALLKQRAIAPEKAEAQLARLKNGFQKLFLLRPATINDGIVRLSEAQINDLLEEFLEESPKMDLLKFVPASGAATRMFKALYADLPENSNFRQTFLENLEQFPFYSQLKEKVAQAGWSLSALRKEDPQQLFDVLLQESGLGYQSYPKGLVPFHHYSEGARTAFEEHLHEGARHAVGLHKTVRIHYTVQSDWLKTVEKNLKQKAKQLTKFEVDKFDLSFSVQLPATDTLAITEDGEILRDESKNLVFRPGGHGALLFNLNALRADLIFVKNIDNVVSDAYKYQGLLYKKVLGGLAIRLQRKIHRFCKAIDQNRVPVSLRHQMERVAKNWLGIAVPKHLTERGEKRAFLIWAKEQFDRPLRICGMVKNEGEPGGGPYWVVDSEGRNSLQIVEKSQFDLSDANHQDILNGATHFNPVDMVCATRNYKGERYNLHNFVDAETGFVSVKSHLGKNIRVLELPGLWNGAMAGWNTIFVEIPSAAFSPVKTVNDLLKAPHQPAKE